MLATICGMGPLYGALFKLDVDSFVPYLSLGVIAWGLLSSVINDSCSVFSGSERLIHSVKLPFAMYVLRSITSNIIIFLHNMIAFVPIAIYCDVQLRFVGVVALLGVILVVLAAFPVYLINGVLCARFRDMQPIVSSVTQLLFFVTPIIWRPELLAGRAEFVRYNPLFPFVEAIRSPLLGRLPDMYSYTFIGLITVVLWLVAFPFFARYRARIAFWV